MKRQILAPSAALLVLAAPLTAFAAGDGPVEADWTTLGSQIFNFCLYLAAIVFLAKGPVKAHFQARREAVTAGMEASKRAAEAAEAKLAETMAKIANFDAERAAILEEFRSLGESERRRIVAAAESDAAKIVREAEATAARDLNIAKVALESKMVDLALEKARADVAARLTPVTQVQLIDNGIDALSGAAN